MSIAQRIVAFAKQYSSVPPLLEQELERLLADPRGFPITKILRPGVFLDIEITRDVFGKKTVTFWVESPQHTLISRIPFNALRWRNTIKSPNWRRSIKWNQRKKHKKYSHFGEYVDTKTYKDNNKIQLSLKYIQLSSCLNTHGLAVQT